MRPTILSLGVRRVQIGLALAAVAAVAALIASAALAKGPDEGRLCGRSGCVALEGYEAAEPFVSWWNIPFTQRPAPKPAPFFRIILRQFEPDPITWTLLYVPRRKAMRITQTRVPPYQAGVGPYWRTVPAAARARLVTTTYRIKPYPPSLDWRAP
jgi:hypothetical protein